ncbi:MAG: ABC transporter ATP-binding protein [Desulfobacteraceae bacterium]|nr:ABC transporter ATP-binding protein [Desulfobacteraceae bacterium]
MELMQARNVTYGYSGSPVLKDVSLSVERGGVLSLLGPNGSGKSTLLKVLLGLYRPERGTVLFEGRPVDRMPRRELAKRIAYVPQTHRMAFSYSVLDVVLMGRTPHRPLFSRYSKEDVDMALHSLDRLSILHLKDRSYTDVSGGERQLTLIARALSQGADTLIMDEPANGLDFGNQIRLLDRIADLAGDGYTCIKSTHFPDHALWIADHVVMLRDGAVFADGKPDDVMTEEAVCELYNTSVSILDLNGGLRTCLPRSVADRMGRGPQRRRLGTAV